MFQWCFCRKFEDPSRDPSTTKTAELGLGTKLREYTAPHFIRAVSAMLPYLSAPFPLHSWSRNYRRSAVRFTIVPAVYLRTVPTTVFPHPVLFYHEFTLINDVRVSKLSSIAIFFYILIHVSAIFLSVYSHFLRTLDMFAYTACFVKKKKCLPWQITQNFLSLWKCQGICWACFSMEILCWALTHLCAGTACFSAYMQVHAYVHTFLLFTSRSLHCT